MKSILILIAFYIFSIIVVPIIVYKMWICALTFDGKLLDTADQYFCYIWAVVVCISLCIICYDDIKMRSRMLEKRSKYLGCD